MSLISSYDPRYLEEQRRRQMMYGAQPPVGIAGSVPQQTVAPMPSIPQMPPQPQPQMGMAAAQGPQGVGLSQQPVVPPAPQPQPQGVSVANNTAASQPSFQQSAEELQKAREMSAFENAQMTGEAPEKKFNSKALGKALSGAFKSGQGLYNQEIQNIGLLREAQAPQMGVSAAMQQPQQQPGMSGAMQAITGGIGSQPQMLEMLKRMRR